MPTHQPRKLGNVILPPGERELLIKEADIYYGAIGKPSVRKERDVLITTEKIPCYLLEVMDVASNKDDDLDGRVHAVSLCGGEYAQPAMRRTMRAPR